jgi:D-sedoheptulose 7-phosphate isomerase
MSLLTVGATKIFHDCFEDHRTLLTQTETACAEPLARLAELCVDALRNGGKLLLFGNGGSAADAQHLSAELTIRFVRHRRALGALALTTDTSALTACANDYGFETVFARQIEALARPRDVAIAFSTSGQSPNIIRALEEARKIGIAAAAFGGNAGGGLNGIADPLIVVPSTVTARIQEMHILLGHVLCAEIEERLGIV